MTESRRESEFSLRTSICISDNLPAEVGNTVVPSVGVAKWLEVEARVSERERGREGRVG